MIPSLPRSTWLRASTVIYAVIFFAFVFLPLVVVAVFAFNDAPYPVLNAVSWFLMVASALLALTLLRGAKAAESQGTA